MKKNKKLKILMASAEVSPFVKVGGLADVMGSLPKEIKKLGEDVRVVMPLYGAIDTKQYNIKCIKNNFEIFSGKKLDKINIWQGLLPGSKVVIYFLEHEKYFGDREIYTKSKNAEKFLFFSLAVTKIFKQIKFIPDIVHCHDFHTALIPNILQVNPETKNIKTLYTIHNMRYQGISEVEILKTGDLSPTSLDVLSEDAKDGDINFMVQGILSSDIINTVSPTYAKEIKTSTYGASIEKVVKMRSKDLYGILNGLDLGNFNPKTDKFILENYSIKSLGKKIKNKLHLQNILKLEQNINTPLVGFVSRLVWQKGIELFTEKFLKLDCQFVFLGNGMKKYEDMLFDLQEKYPKKIRFINKFDLKLAQEIYAGSDMFLMPSRFEPCGLGQMIAMRYGTLPIVRKTGGLADTVNSNNGFIFKSFTKEDLFNITEKAIKLFHEEPKKWRKMQILAMKKDFSWKKSAKEYLELYKKAFKKVI